MSGAVEYLFNCLAHEGCGSSPEERSAPVGRTLDAPFTTVEQYIDFGGKAALTGAVTIGPQFAIATLLDASGATVATVTTNQIAGNAFRDEVAGLLRSAGYEVRTEVSKSTIFGRRVIDIDVWKNGVNLGGIETKLGSSVYHAAQRAKDAWLQLNGYIVNVVRGPK
jgi:hypothetical protein